MTRRAEIRERFKAVVARALTQPLPLQGPAVQAPRPGRPKKATTSHVVRKAASLR